MFEEKSIKCNQHQYWTKISMLGLFGWIFMLNQNFLQKGNQKKWQLVMHFHLRLPVPPVILGFNDEANSADLCALVYPIQQKWATRSRLTVI